MNDPLELKCPQCQKTYASQGGASLLKIELEPYGEAVLCRLCQLRLERDGYRNRVRELEGQPEDKWEPALTPESKVTLTLTGVDLDDLANACQSCLIVSSNTEGAKPGSLVARWKKLARWLRAVINNGPADAGGCLADWPGLDTRA